MKKVWKWVPLLLLAALLMQGCSSLGIGSKDKSKVTLKVLTSSTQFNAYVPLLKEKFPHLSFEVVDVNGKLRQENTPATERESRAVEIIEAEQPDLYYNFSPNYYTEESRLVDLAPLIERDHVQLNEVQQQVVASTVDSEGVLTSISPSIDRYVLFVNRKLLQEHSIAEPSSPMSWEVFRETALALKEKNQSLSGYEMSDSWWSYYSIFVGETMMGFRSIENGQLTLDRPEWRALTEQLVEDYQNQIAKNDGYNPDFSERQRTGMFVEKASYVHNMLSSNATTDSWSIMELPNGFGYTGSTSYLLPAAFSLDKSSKHIEEAWKLIIYLMSEEGASLISSNSLSSGFVTYPQYVNIGDFSTDVIYQSQGRAAPISTESLKNAPYLQFNNVMQKQLSDAASGSITFEQAWTEVENIVRELNADPANFITRSN
ncbi:ABC transporter substrate-binding protein [Paenibacillus sp. 1011MAR3C5]|uniref:ABC transporter substrate-binding protein n=1 Tax=Paenibacillus sp. 1011MAR3C5 TaxID=1675787 RepID=UPI0015FF329B|nr:extracellular solute-binding protein [Paenibacillus sp. 1011MAR3C5]